MPKISHQNVWVGNLFTGNLQRWKDYWNKELTIRANKWTLNYKEEGKGSAKGFSFAKSSVESLPGKKVALGLFDKSLMNPICLSRYSYKRDRAWPICFKNNLPYLFLSTHLTSGIVLIIEAAEEPTWVPVCPDWAIFCTLGNNSKHLATINLPKSPTFLVNFL